jgi:hypothetical protein
VSGYNPTWQQRALLAAGYLAFAIGVLSAWSDPGRRYELDIYAATPSSFWLGIGMAGLIGLFVAYHGTVTRGVRIGALGLLGLAIFGVLGLPIVRNYYFFGPGDSLSHLGWTRLIDQGRLSPFGLLYPGIHTAAIFVKSLLDVSLLRAMQFVVLFFTAIFVVFVPLCVRALTDARWAVVTGFVAALLLLPINNVSVFHLPYPTAQAIFFIPFMLYLAIKYLTLPAGSFPRSVTALGVLLALASIAIVVLHPQQAGSVLLVFGGIVGVQFLYRRYRSDHPISDQRPFYAQFGVLLLAFLLWTPRFDRSQTAGESFVNGLLGAEPVGDEVTTRSTSLSILGGSIEELFLKLFGVALVFSIVAGFVALLGLLGRLDDDPVRGTSIRYLSVGLGFLGITFLLFFAGSVSVFPFRYLGAIMVIVTILAVVGLVEGIPFGIPWPSWRVIQTVAVLVFGVFLALQIAHVHESPYIYQSSDQVTKTTMVGYENTFETRDSEVWFTGIDGGPSRYVDAIYGTTRTERTPDGQVFEGKEATIRPSVWGNNMTQHYGRDRYVPVTTKDRQTEVGLYDGLRYSADGFRALETTPRIHRVRSNGDYRLYYIDENE